ncbi:MAG: hypothetical protein K5756_05770 [Clostridiales bacterium]|nr:hypothetical protein [Clostridiales bacterium]
MLSKDIIRKNSIYSVCEKSGRILPGDKFKGVHIADNSSDSYLKRIPDDAGIICCGCIDDSEILFRTENGRFYFSVCDGWGESDGVLYGLNSGVFFDFKHPTTETTILAECDARGVSAFGTFGKAMKYQARNSTLDVIRSVMGKDNA